MDKQELGWSTMMRLRFIEFRLFWEGRINRGDLITRFGISVPQSSLDIRSYLALAPGNMEYDKQRKGYFASSSFKPVLDQPDAQDYLSQIAMLGAGLENAFSLRENIGVLPDFAIVPPLQRTVDSLILRALLSAIRNKQEINIYYQSMTTPEPSWRLIVPHALGTDGFRWHIRAYCFKREKFIDFVLGRILEVGEVAQSNINSEKDIEWHTIETVTITAHPELSEGQRKIIEFEYGMTDGKLSINIRKALVFYLEKKLGLISNETPASKQISLSIKAA